MFELIQSILFIFSKALELDVAWDLFIYRYEDLLQIVIYN